MGKRHFKTHLAGTAHQDFERFRRHVDMCFAGRLYRYFLRLSTEETR